MNPAVLVHHRRRIRARTHLAGAAGVTGNPHTLLEPCVQRVIRGQLGIGGRQALLDQAIEPGMLEQAYTSANTFPQAFQVPRMGQELVVQLWLDLRVVGSEG